MRYVLLAALLTSCSGSGMTPEMAKNCQLRFTELNGRYAMRLAQKCWLYVGKGEQVLEQCPFLAEVDAEFDPLYEQEAKACSKN